MRVLTSPLESRTTHRRATPEGGSAYIVALLSLVVLSAIGLGVALVTQTEMQIGANERTVQRAFYAADAGIATSTARALIQADYMAATYSMEDVSPLSGLELRHELDASPFYPIADSPCNLCAINNAGAYSEKAYRRINHAVTVVARRQGKMGTGADTRLSEKMITAMLEVQPWKVGAEAYLPADKPEELKKIKF